MLNFQKQLGKKLELFVSFKFSPAFRLNLSSINPTREIKKAIEKIKFKFLLR